MRFKMFEMCGSAYSQVKQVSDRAKEQIKMYQQNVYNVMMEKEREMQINMTKKEAEEKVAKACGVPWLNKGNIVDVLEALGFVFKEEPKKNERIFSRILTEIIGKMYVYYYRMQLKQCKNTVIIFIKQVGNDYPRDNTRGSFKGNRAAFTEPSYTIAC